MAIGDTHIDEQFNASVAPAGTALVSVNCHGYAQLTVVWQLLATTTAADLASAALNLYRADGATVIPGGYPTVRTLAAVSDGTNVVQENTYDVRGLARVRLIATNNNVGAKTLIVTTYLGSA